MRATILLPIFNKENYIRRCLEACLAQTHPTTICIFGPTNTDGTDRVIRKIIDGYMQKLFEPNTVPKLRDMVTAYPNKPCDSMGYQCGQHTVWWVIVPDNGLAGSNGGMNIDFNWIHQHDALKDTDICLFVSADDVPHPDRVKRTVETFEKHNPSWLVCKQMLMKEDGQVVGECPAIPDRESRWIGKAEAIRMQVGSSGGFAWAKDLYDKYAPVRHIESNDVILPVLSLFERGMYYLDEPLMTMFLHDDLNNLGMEGQVRGARTEDERLQLLEVSSFHAASNWDNIVRRLVEHGLQEKMSPDAQNAITEKLMGGLRGWTQTREELTMRKLKPLAFGAKALGLME